MVAAPDPQQNTTRANFKESDVHSDDLPLQTFQLTKDEGIVKNLPNRKIESDEASIALLPEAQKVNTERRFDLHVLPFALKLSNSLLWREV